MAAQVLISADREDMVSRIRAMLTKHGLDCPNGFVVPLEAAADRAARVAPGLLIFVLPQNANAVAAIIRETRRRAPNSYLVAIGPAIDEQLILRILDDGSDEYLDHTNLETELSGMIARFKVQDAPKAKETSAGWVIAVLSPSGGSGSSIVAANISATLALEHGQCALIDLRLSSGDLSSMFNLRPTHSLADVCDQLARIDRSMLEQFFVRHASGVFLLAAPNNYADARRISPKGVRQTFAIARVRFPYVVTDLDNVHDEVQTEALWQADVIVLMVRMDYTSVRNTRRMLDNLATLGVKLDRVRLVANGCGERKQLTQGQAEEALGMKFSLCIPSDPTVILPTINNGEPAVINQPSAKVSKILRQLAQSCNGHYPPKSPTN